MTRLFALAVVAIVAALHYAAWGWFNQPIPVGLSFDEPFASVSFAPFRRGQSPLTHDYPTTDQIADDLRRLVGVTRGVRTYTSLEGMEVVPEIAQKLGLEVTQSAWLGEKPTVNRREVEALIAAANRYPDTIKRVIVGNEVLLRQDLPVEDLIAYIRMVKSRVSQPVSYADVWAFWLKYPEVAREVDFITIHILPYWEDEPVGVDDGARHLVQIYRRMADTFPGKPILIGEAGWPTQGRSRGPAVASIANGAVFVRTLAKVSKENGFDYNVVEAFDQPWKARLEGTVGAKWGVLDADRAVKFTMSGPVDPNPRWRIQGGIAAAIGALAGGIMVLGARRYRPVAMVAVAILAHGLAGLVVWQAVNAQAIAFDLTDQAWAWTRTALHAALAVLLARAAGSGFAQGAAPVDDRIAERVVPFYALAGLVSSVLLLAHGRYRDIPTLEFLVPCLGLTAFALARMVVLRLDWRQAFAIGRMFGGANPGGYDAARILTFGLAGAALVSLGSEAVALARGDDFIRSHPTLADQLPLLARSLWINQEMVVWAAMLVVMALPYLADWRLNRRR